MSPILKYFFPSFCDIKRFDFEHTQREKREIKSKKNHRRYCFFYIWYVFLCPPLSSNSIHSVTLLYLSVTYDNSNIDDDDNNESHNISARLHSTRTNTQLVVKYHKQYNTLWVQSPFWPLFFVYFWISNCSKNVNNKWDTRNNQRLKGAHIHTQ